MENTILIGSLIMALTSLLSLAGVLIRTGKLVGQVERLQETNEKLEQDVSEMSAKLAGIETSVEVLKTKMEYLSAFPANTEIKNSYAKPHRQP